VNEIDDRWLHSNVQGTPQISIFDIIALADEKNATAFVVNLKLNHVNYGRVWF